MPSLLMFLPTGADTEAHHGIYLVKEDDESFGE
jgi:hypothetical protein